MEVGDFATIQELVEAVGLVERHVSLRLRLAYLTPKVLKGLVCGREVPAFSLYALLSSGGSDWGLADIVLVRSPMGISSNVASDVIATANRAKPGPDSGKHQGNPPLFWSDVRCD